MQPGTSPWRSRASAKRWRSSAPRSLLPVGVVIGLVGLFCTAVGLGQVLGIPLPSLASLFGGASQQGPYDRATPTRITIPSIDVRAQILEVGRAGDGSIAAPDADPVRATGWFHLGPSPGELGTAVIVGHIDTRDQPAVFARLSQLTAGATIEVRRNDLQTVTFTVDSLESHPKASFPADKVFEPADKPRLALVTCGGKWLGGDIGYANNLIIMATLAS
jgi:hypothetical protein